MAVDPILSCTGQLTGTVHVVRDVIQRVDLVTSQQEINELFRQFMENSPIYNLPKLPCNAQQINQVFMNLLINAVHAIQAKGEEVGEICIRSWCDQDNAFVSISDTGCGIDPLNQNKVFDAFYTTKDVGKGTGLGCPSRPVSSANMVGRSWWPAKLAKVRHLQSACR